VAAAKQRAKRTKKSAKRQAASRPRGRATNGVADELRAFGLGYPGAHTKSPWPGHLDLAVKEKTFAFLSATSEPLRITCKLPRSGTMALLFPFATPTEYGLGKSGWVTATFAPGDQPPVDMLKDWIDESYRAQAPKRLVAALDEAKPKSKPKSKSKPR
jgi:hypothetical protein